MSIRLLRPIAAVMLLGPLAASWAGCSGLAPPDAEQATPAASNATKAVRLETIDAAGLTKVLQAHRGEVVLVDVWATWCDPCRELFPHSVALHNRLGPEGLAVISLSLDDPDTDRAAALTFLEGQNAAFQNFISPYGAGTESIEAFELDGVLPELKLYDRQGNLHRTFGGLAGPVDVDQLDRAVAELLAEG